MQKDLPGYNIELAKKRIRGLQEKYEKEIKLNEADYNEANKVMETEEKEIEENSKQSFESLSNSKEFDKRLENFNPKEHSISKLCKEKGTGITAINETNKEGFYPLLMAIEEAIWNHYQEDNSVKDSDVIESLKNIRDTIFSNNIKLNGMENSIITRIKLVLFLNNYDKRDLSLSISKVLKSAKLHKSMGGSRGYLNFISGFFSQLE